MAFKSAKVQKCGTLDNIPGITDDIRSMYRDLKRMESTTSIISDISEEDARSKEDDSGALADRLHGVDLSDADVIWSKLSETERQKVGQVAQQHNVMAVLPSFYPWWENKVQRIEISEVDGDHINIVATEHEFRNLKHPKIKKSITEFAQITPKTPVENAENNLTNILAAYTSTVRFFYGEHMRSAYEAVKYLFVICSSLKSNASFVDPKLAIEAVQKEARKEGLTIDDDDVMQMKKDIASITEGPDPNHQTNCYILAALSDLYRMFQLAKSKSKSSLAHRNGPISSNSTLEVVPPKEQAKEFHKFIDRFGDYKIVEFVTMDRKKISSTLDKVEYFLAYAKKFMSFT